MRVTVVGAGAIGGSIGAFLARSGVDVQLCDADHEHVAAMRQSGLKITGAMEFTVQVEAITPEELAGPLDIVFLCTKAMHADAAMERILPLLSDKGFVVSVQNGLGNYAPVDAQGTVRAVGCYVNFMADLLEPGCILYGGPGDFELGEVDGRPSERVERLGVMMAAAMPMPVRVSPELMGHLWGKLALAAMLYVTALASIDVEELYDVARYRALCADAAAEVLRVAERRGIVCLGSDGFEPSVFRLGAKAPAAEIDACYREIQGYWHRSRKVRSGIWRDLAVRKRRTEVDFDVLPIVEMAAQMGIATSLLGRVVQMIHEAEAGTRALDAQNLDELADFAESLR